MSEVADLQADHQAMIDAGAHPLIVAARLEILQEAIQRAADEQEGLYRLRKAILLAPTLEVCEALLRGEHVPLAKLNQRTLARMKRRTG